MTWDRFLLQQSDLMSNQKEGEYSIYMRTVTVSPWFEGQTHRTSDEKGSKLSGMVFVSRITQERRENWLELLLKFSRGR